MRRRAVAAGAIGNFVEWYDFIAYGALAAFLAPLFFPGDDPVASLLLTFGAFAIAFVFRPIGGFIFGRLGDLRGRRAALSASLLIMAAATFAIGLLPTAAAVGSLAPILLVTLRCIQGLAAGAEWSGSAVYLVESGPKDRRALSASLTPIGAWLGSAAGVAVVLLLNATVGPEAISEWAWRIPFLVAAPLGLVGLYLRLRIQDTPAFQQLQNASKVERSPIRESFRTHKKAMLLIFLGGAAQNVATYALVAFMIAYLTRTLLVPVGDALVTNTIALVAAGIGTVVSGLLADRLGRRPTFIGALALLAVAVIPLFLLIGRADFASVLIGQVVLGFLIGLPLAPLAVYCVELFPARVRYAGSGISYSLAAGLVGGSSPLIGTALLGATGWALAPAIYIVAMLVIGAIAAIALAPETSKLALAAEEEKAVDDLSELSTAPTS